jgi:hypothetical protein
MPICPIKPSGLLRWSAVEGSPLSRSVQVACTPPRIRQLLRLTGLNRRITLPRTLDEAPQARLAARPGGLIASMPRSRMVT